MSEIVQHAVKALNEKLDGGGIDGSVKLLIEGEGSVLVDEAGARAEDGPADCVMAADADTFRGMLEGGVDPTGAFMSGRLKIEGDMGLAMKLGSILA